MNLNCSNLSRNDRVSKLSAIFNTKPELLYKNPYINFLREFRIRHLDLEIPELYHEAAIAWIKLSDKEKKTFRYLDVIRDIKRRRAMKVKHAKLAKKRRRKIPFSSRRVMRKNKRKTFPIITTIKRRSQRKRTKIGNKKVSQKKASPNTDRVRRILKSLRMIDTTPKTGRRRQIRTRGLRQRQRVQRRRRVNRRK